MTLIGGILCYTSPSATSDWAHKIDKKFYCNLQPVKIFWCSSNDFITLFIWIWNKNLSITIYLGFGQLMRCLVVTLSLQFKLQWKRDGWLLAKAKSTDKYIVNNLYVLNLCNHLGNLTSCLGVFNNQIMLNHLRALHLVGFKTICECV